MRYILVVVRALRGANGGAIVTAVAAVTAIAPIVTVAAAATVTTTSAASLTNTATAAEAGATASTAAAEKTAGSLPAVAPRERIDRGLVARPLAGSRVYLSWRLLADDPATVAFNVYRRQPDGEPVKLNPAPLRQTTDFIDESPLPGEEQAWFVRAVVDGREGPASPDARTGLRDKPQPFISIKLDGEHTFQKVGIADLDGDGRYDFVIKQPNVNIDPSGRYWRPSPGTYKLEAYRHDGRLLWRYDLGWAIEQGIWYSPYVVYDLDGDGKAEVAVKTGEGDPRDKTGRVKQGAEWLTILDGLTGKLLARTAWLAREDFESYNFASRNQMCVAYLDGQRPSLVVARGTYNIIKLVAYQFRQGKLHEQWRWDSRQAPQEYSGQGAHWMQAVDVDGDGRDEVLIGSALIGSDGRPRWSTALGHPDHAYVGKLDPERTGLQIYYGIENRRENNGMCLVEAATGQILWGLQRPTRHVHSAGLVSDFDPAQPGAECYSADTDAQKNFAYALIHDCCGRLIGEEDLGGFAPRAVYWDADLQRELLNAGRIWKFRGPNLAPPVEGEVIAVADILGDWREEIITTLPGELRIYVTSIPATDRRPCLMQDPLYRMNVVCAAMGYYQVPLTSYDLATGRGR